MKSKACQYGCYSKIGSGTELMQDSFFKTLKKMLTVTNLTPWPKTAKLWMQLHVDFGKLKTASISKFL